MVFFIMRERRVSRLSFYFIVIAIVFVSFSVGLLLFVFDRKKTISFLSFSISSPVLHRVVGPPGQQRRDAAPAVAHIGLLPDYGQVFGGGKGRRQQPGLQMI